MIRGLTWVQYTVTLNGKLEGGVMTGGTIAYRGERMEDAYKTFFEVAFSHAATTMQLSITSNYNGKIQSRYYNHMLNAATEGFEL